MNDRAELRGRCVRPRIPPRLPVLSAVLAALASWALAAPLAAQLAPTPVEIAADGVFGRDAFLSGGYTTLAVRANNRTASAIQGEVVVEARTWDHIVSVHRAPLDLPAQQSRITTLTVPAFDDGLQFEVSYRAGGVSLARFTASLNYGGSARPIVLLDDPPRLRGPLVGTRVSLYEPQGYYGGPRETEVPIGVVTSDARSGDLVLPDSAAGWSTVLFAVGTVTALGGADETELAALEGWIRAGGRLVVMPTHAADLDHPFLRRTVGTLTREAEEASLGLLLGSDTPALHCPDTAVRELFGCQSRVGFGTIWVTDDDLSQAAYASRPEVQEIFRAIARSVAGGDDRVHAYMPFARGADRAQDSWMPGPNVNAVRSALDPNEGYRPALVLVGVVLMFYVLLVGPVNFMVVERRRQPTLALITTPILAMLCVMVTFFVGYVGKGVQMRYRRVEFLDTVADSPIAVSRRYTGFFFTRPGTTDVELPPGAVALRIGSDGAGDGPRTREGADHRTLEDMRAGLWETAFIREDATTQLGGGIHFVLDGRRIAQVRNDSPLPLRGAFMTDLVGGVYRLGEIPAGATVEVPTTATSFLAIGERPSGDYWSGSNAFVGSLDAQSDVREAMLAILGMSDEAPSGGLLPVLYARLDPDAPPSSSPSFDGELDVRLLRVVPNLLPTAIYVPGMTPDIFTSTAAAPPPRPTGAPPATTPATTPSAPVSRPNEATMPPNQPAGGAP